MRPLKRPPSLVPALPAALLLVLLAGCGTDDDQAGTSTETIAGKTTGIIREADGTPAPGARIRAYPVDYRHMSDSSAVKAVSATADAAGRFVLSRMPRGHYTLLGEHDGKAAYLDSVDLTDTATRTAELVLGPPGRLSGHVSLQPGAPLQAVTVQVLGTLAYANADALGRFTLPTLAAGAYRALVSADLPDYASRHVSILVRGGGAESLRDTLSPIYTGIPLVMGLRGSYDTLAMDVRLAWSGSDYPNLDEYLVYRDPAGSVEKSTRAIAAVKDTVFVDSLADVEKGLTAGSTFEYRVAMRDAFQAVGRTYGAEVVRTPPRTQASTALDLQVQGSRNGTASVGDTVRLVARFNNPTRSHTLLAWRLDGQDAPLRTFERPARSGEDTLAFVCPATPGRRTLSIELRDEAGAAWRDSTILDVVLDPPRVRMTADTTVTAGTEIRLYAAISQDFGHIVRMEWDIGGTGRLVVAGSNDTTFLAPEAGSTGISCIFRATDDDGNAAEDTTLVRVDPWKPAPPLPIPLAQHMAVVIDGKILVMGGTEYGGQDYNRPSARVFLFDPASGRWTERKSMHLPRTRAAAAVVDGIVYVVGGSEKRANLGNVAADEFAGPIEVYDPLGDTWTLKSPLPTPRKGHTVVALDGRLHVLGGYVPHSPTSSYTKPAYTIDVYDPAADSWTSSGSTMPVWGALASVGYGAEAYVFSAWTEQRGRWVRYRPADGTWTDLGLRPIPDPADNGGLHAVAHAGEALYVLGGTRFEGNILPSRPGKVNRYDLQAGKWEAEFPLPHSISDAAAVHVGGSLYLIGGFNADRSQGIPPWPGVLRMRVP